MITCEALKKCLAYNPITGCFRWLVTTGRAKVGIIAGCLHHEGYRLIKINWRKYPAHWLAFLYMKGRWPKSQMDHINGLRADNRWKNLREATNKLNSENRRRANRNNGSKLLGAYRYPGGWRSAIGSNGKIYQLGCFRTAKQAHQAYVRAKRKLHAGCTL